MRLVVDASVALKWFFRDPDREADVDAALSILDRFVTGDVQLLAPVHFQAEMCAVLVRQAPSGMHGHLSRLANLSIPVCDHVPLLARAMSLSRELEHHLFDTLYHAVAIEEEAVLVTADRRYWSKARGLGSIVELARWQG